MALDRCCIGDGATEAVDCRARLDMVGCGCGKSYCAGRKSKSKVPTRRVEGSFNDRQAQDRWTLFCTPLVMPSHFCKVGSHSRTFDTQNTMHKSNTERTGLPKKEKTIHYAIRTLFTTTKPLVTLAAHAVLQYRVRYHLFFALSITFSSNRRTNILLLRSSSIVCFTLRITFTW